MTNPEDEVGIYFKARGDDVFRIVSVLRAAGGVGEISIHGPRATTMPILEGFEDSGENPSKPDLFTWLPDQNGDGKVGVVTPQDWLAATRGNKDISSGTLGRIENEYRKNANLDSSKAALLRKYLYIELDEAGREDIKGMFTHTLPELVTSLKAQRIRVTGVGTTSINQLQTFCEKLGSQYPEALRGA